MVKIERKYHFYAAHRNQSLAGKCRNIHGHRYGVVLVIEPGRTEAGVTMLFDDIDRLVDPILEEYDHGLLIDINDPLYQVLTSLDDQTKMLRLNRETSVENLAASLFAKFDSVGLPMVEVRIQETDSSILIYDKQDHERDRQ